MENYCSYTGRIKIMVINYGRKKGDYALTHYNENIIFKCNINIQNYALKHDIKILYVPQLSNTTCKLCKFHFHHKERTS
jgi:hypothetical protein